MPLFSARAASSFGFADLYSQGPDLQLERCSESSVSVYHFQLCFCIFFRCYVIYCNLWYLSNVIYSFILYIFLYSGGIVVITMKCSSVCVLLCVVLKVSALSLPGKLRVLSVGIRALVYRAREQDTLEPYERIHQILD